MKTVTDTVVFRRGGKHWTVVIQFRATKGDQSHLDFEAREVAEGISALTPFQAYWKALRSKRDLLKKWQKLK